MTNDLTLEKVLQPPSTDASKRQGSLMMAILSKRLKQIISEELDLYLNQMMYIDHGWLPLALWGKITPLNLILKMKLSAMSVQLILYPMKKPLGKKKLL